VQYVIRPQTAEHPDYRGYAGQISSGVMRIDDVVVVVPSGSGSTVVRRSGGIWYLGEGPEGRPVATVVHGGALWVVTTDVTSTGSLARATIP
jgi:sulfate adenylyltransferase subunit 1 (EFTu-like GTPase family)